MRLVLILGSMLGLSATVAAQQGAPSRPKVDVLLRQLRSEDPDDVAFAEKCLVEAGPEILQALGELVFELEIHDEQAMLRVPWIGFRRDARLDAARTPPESLLPGDRFLHGDDAAESPYDAVETDIEPEQRRDHDALWAATRVLVRLGPPALPLLARMLADPPRAHAAATALGRLGPPAVRVAEGTLEAPHPIVRGESVRVLGLAGDATPDELLPAIVAALRSADPRTHRRAAWTLVRLGPRAVPALGALLADRASSVEDRCRALAVVALLAARAQPVAERVLALLEGGEAELAPWAAQALGRMGLSGDIASRAAAALTGLCERAPRPARIAALEALGGMPAAATGALPLLTRSLAVTDEDVRLVATVALGRIAAPASLEPLAQRLHDPSPRVRRAAAAALVAFGERAVPCLLATLEPLATETQDAVVDALVRIGTACVPGLAKKALAGDPHVRRGAILGLGRLCGAAPEALATLAKLLGGDDESMRRCAISALGGAGSRGANRAVLLLTPCLRDESPWVRYSTVQALGQLGPAAAGAVPALMDALDDDVLEIRVAAAEALAEIGPAARAALPVLRKIADDGPEPLQSAARAAARSVAASPR
jgi:HEAT repeat protein